MPYLAHKSKEQALKYRKGQGADKWQYWSKDHKSAKKEHGAEKNSKKEHGARRKSMSNK